MRSISISYHSLLTGKPDRAETGPLSKEQESFAPSSLTMLQSNGLLDGFQFSTLGEPNYFLLDLIMFNKDSADSDYTRPSLVKESETLGSSSYTSEFQSNGLLGDDTLGMYP